MKGLILLTGLLVIYSLTTIAKQIDEKTAKQVGKAFLLQSTKVLKKNVSLDLIHKSTLFKSDNLNEKSAPITFFYVFNDKTNGFIIVAGDDNVTPILGYSDDGVFNPNNIPPTVQKWLDEYKNQIQYTIENNISATPEIQEKWTNLSAITPSFASRAAQSVNPLMQTKWNQSPNENALCPFDNAYNERTVTGCPATAMAQIMKYWNYPTTGTGFHSYNHQKYGTLSANFGNTSYQWSSMPNTLSSSNNAVSTLMYHCGVAVEMDYGVAATGGSGSYVIIAYSPTVQQTCENAFKTYFGYNASTLQGLKRSNYSDNDWINLLKTELDQSRPIQYAGFGSGGHTWVCDGYDNNNYFHMNWGWGGSQDGYYLLNALNPGAGGIGGAGYSYNDNQQALIGIQPPSGATQPNYDLQLYSSISMASTQIWFTNAFSLTVDIANFGTGTFSGQYGAAIFDKNYNFVDFMEVKSSMTLNSNSHYTTPLNFSNAGSAKFVPGTYYVAMYYKTTSKDWTIIGNGSYTNLKQFEIKYSSDIETNSNFTISTNGGKLIQGSTSTVNVDLINSSSTTFYGQYRISLSNLDGTLAQSIQVLNENNGLPYNYHYTNGANFTGSITVTPGTYLLEVAYKVQGSSSWYYAGSSNFSNPVYVIVEALSLSPDQYENNNTASNAYDIPISFTGNTSSFNSNGSNIHVGTDYDYYKVNLAAGFNYTLSARLHDSYNSGNGNAYTVDGLIAYSIDNGNTWSNFYDDIISENITIQNSGAVYFHVAPSFSGRTGTYLLDLTVNRTDNTGFNDNKLSELIKVYPNPATEFITVDLNEFSGKVYAINIINQLGQQIRFISIAKNNKNIKIPLDGIPNGVYIIQVQSLKGILTKQIIVRQ